MSYTPVSTYSSNNLITMIPVNSQQAALTYAMLPNMTLYFMDLTNPVWYTRTTDNMGNTIAFDVYDIIKRETQQQTVQPQQTEYVQKSELEALVTAAVEQALAKTRKHNNQQRYNKKEVNNG